MINLLLKDFRIVRPLLIPCLAGHILFATSYFRESFSFLLANALLTLSWVVLIPILDDKYKGNPLLGSLPVQRSQFVLARYASSFALILFGLLLYLSLGYLLGALFAGYTSHPPPQTSLAGALLFLLLTVVLSLLFLPLYFGQGLGRALLIFPAAVAAAGVLLWALVRLASAAMDIPMLPMSDPEKAALKERALALGGADMELLLWKAKILGIGLLTAILAGLTWLSAALSIRLFQRRDL